MYSSLAFSVDNVSEDINLPSDNDVEEGNYKESSCSIHNVTDDFYHIDHRIHS